jgi:hypothetical protein
MKQFSQIITEAKSTSVSFGDTYPKRGGVYISSTHNNYYQVRDFESFTKLTADQAIDVLKYIIDNTPFKSGRADIFYSGYAGWSLYDKSGKNIGGLYYDRTKQCWTFKEAWGTHDNTMKKAMSDALEKMAGYDKLGEKELEILRYIDYGRMGTSSITRQMADYIKKEYKEVDRADRNDKDKWYIVYKEGADSKYGRFAVRFDTKEYGDLDILEFGVD